MLLAHADALAEISSFTPFLALLSGYAVIVALLTVFGRPGTRGPVLGRFLLRIPDALERATGVPGWAAAAVGTSLFAVAVAGVGFYDDVAWHIALGRDKELFTAPHTGIVVGLALIPFAGAVGVLFATLQRADVGFRLGKLRVPWSCLALGVLGVTALSGFPLDDLWHARYGIDVTMWSPTHMIMILGASLTPLAAWLALGEAGARPDRRRATHAVHVFAAVLTVQGLSASQGEFVFGVPQFQQLYLPVLVSIAAAFAMVASRLVLGRGGALEVAVINLVVSFTIFQDRGPLDIKETGLYVASALAVEAAALSVGTASRLRFAAVAGIGVGTIGLAGEWALNTRAFQPWTTDLLPEAVILATLAGIGAAVLAAAFAGGVVTTAPRMSGRLAAVGAVAVLVALAVPFPRNVGDVTADIRFVPRGDRADLEVVLDPPDAADDVRWFQVMTWQGGGHEALDLQEAGAGRWVLASAVPLTGPGKTVLRLHRGDELMAVPLRFPADPEIGEPAIEPVSRRAAFEPETRYLLREQRPGAQGFAYVVYGLDVLILLSWSAALVLAVRRPATAVTDRAGASPDRAIVS
ncbi:MAG TPA: hypothetical protein VM938_12855 [Acidimicrobiales bacterium]|nr:hypothetical protein [Acidimicrobiales bacterium]